MSTLFRIELLVGLLAAVVGLTELFWIELLFGLVVAVFGGFAFIMVRSMRVRLKQQKAFEVFLEQQEFAKVAQPKAINDEPFLVSPIMGRTPPNESVYEAWEKRSPLGQVRVLFLQTKSTTPSDRKVLLEAKVEPAVQDFYVFPGPVPNWMAKGVGMITGMDIIALPFDLKDRYTIAAAQPIEIPDSLLEYLRLQEGLHVTVAASSLLVERREQAGLGSPADIWDPETFERALADLTALVPLVSAR